MYISRQHWLAKPKYCELMIQMTLILIFIWVSSMFTRTNDNVIKTTLGSIKMGFRQILLQLMLKNISNFFITLL